MAKKPDKILCALRVYPEDYQKFRARAHATERTLGAEFRQILWAAEQYEKEHGYPIQEGAFSEDKKKAVGDN